MNRDEHPNNSTIVRAPSLGLRAARAGFRLLGPAAPDVAIRCAEHLFLTARRRERSSWEEDALASATPSRVPFDGGFIPTWTWAPTLANAALVTEDRPAVILVHGWEGRGSQLAAFAPPLVEKGLRVVTFDGPGHGDSPLARSSLIEHARALLAVVKATRRVHAVIAHSFGGTAALLATRFGLTLSRLGLVAPSAGPHDFTTSFARALGLGSAIKAGLIARLEDRYGIRFAELDARLDARRFDAPMLVVHDATDPVVPWTEGDAIAAAAPHGRLVTTQGLGHRAILRSPAVVDEVASFVRDGTAAPTFLETLEGELFARHARW